MSRPARRQHFIARFYLRNFAVPMFSDDLLVCDLSTNRWEKRTPEGVGWFPHLCSMFNTFGSRTDAFDQHFKRTIEDPAAPALKQLATGAAIDDTHKSAIAKFMALTAARNPRLLGSVEREHLTGLSPADRAEMEADVNVWCELSGRQRTTTSDADFLKPSTLAGVWYWTGSLHRRLCSWNWFVLRTTSDEPFICSDRPVFAEWDQPRDIRLISFPVSSETAVLVSNHDNLPQPRERLADVRAVNTQTLMHATEFVVSCQRSFPGDELLLKRASGAG